MTIDVRTVKADREVEGSLEKGALFRLAVDGQGCGAAGCRCSPPNYVTLSDGKTLLTLALSERQAALIRNEGRINLTTLTEEAQP